MSCAPALSYGRRWSRRPCGIGTSLSRRTGLSRPGRTEPPEAERLPMFG